MTQEQFIQALSSRGISLSEKQITQFQTYMRLLQEWNEKMNLTAIVKDEEVWEKHFYDSILPFIGLDLSSFCDVGSGAGFPGIPVKIVYPDCEMTLIEPLQKRCLFLEEVVSQLKLENISVMNVRAEEYAKEHRALFSIVSARAVAKLSILLELCIPLLKVDGIFVALKGKNGDQELKQAKKALSLLHVKLIKEEKTTIEEDATRINFYFQKVQATPIKYPRAYGQIKKKPLEEQ